MEPGSLFSLREQTREYIHKAYEYFAEESKRQLNLLNSDNVSDKHPIVMMSLTEDLQYTTKRIAQAFGIAEPTVERILTEKKLREKRIHTSLIQEGILREESMHDLLAIIKSYNKTHRAAPPLAVLQIVFKEKFGEFIDESTMRRTIRKLGFKWCSNPKKPSELIIKETHESRRALYYYLKKIIQYRTECKNIVYMAQSLLSPTFILKRPYEEYLEQLQKQVIVVLMGSQVGLVPVAFLTYKQDLNVDVEDYEEWLKNHVIPQLGENTVVVLHSAPYNNIKEALPNMLSCTLEMKQWLTENNIKYECDLSNRFELYDLIKTNKDKHRFRVDRIFNDSGIEVLRIPPYHPELNPVESIWSVLDKYVKEQRVEPEMLPLVKLVQDWINQNNWDRWPHTYGEVVNTEKTYYKNFNIPSSFDDCGEPEVDNELTDSASEED